MDQKDHHYQMLNKTLVWGAALFLLTLGWFLPPSNTHFTFSANGTVRTIDTISATRCVAVKRVKGEDKVWREVPSDPAKRVPVGPEVISQAEDKGTALTWAGAAVVLVWAALVMTLNWKRSIESRSLFPSFHLVWLIAPLGGLAYMWFILNIADFLPIFLGGSGTTSCS